ncbi:tryptophan 2,3-dioxygenase family protein [Paracrocinitomix mangrovi]|uniref:tryptophan 2,3-dioxygenase family protein n=1 Tax=Paracrocinitomix mangrovi TaxID=2862509 RepID=UPI001C8D475D|nr:tryptophan 2,3-dioxygenase family protein [Paracrocinitomix mangrovi]UKN00674.1 tryptophan 2,3-dioxygenase family protein [Paracrocinitomix mangrovi]
MELSESTLERLKLLKEKYAAIGQDLDSYLDGLIFANPLAYWDYIEVDALLSLQKPKTDFPDEKIFIVYHQITELYFYLIQHELDQICRNGKIISDIGQDLGWNKELKADFFIERLKRCNMYFNALTRSFDIMRLGMEKEQFTKFRMSLLSASGFQTASYRKIEISCTDLKYLVHENKRKQLWDADIHEQLDNIYWREGAIVEETGEKTLTLRDFEEKYLDEFHDFADVYQPMNLWKKYKSLSDVDQANTELIKELRELDVNVNINWPLVHYRTAVHYLATKGESKGTGGTNWQKYLPPRFQRRIFYPELWSEKEMEEWGKRWVEEVFAETINTEEKLKDKL